jgi:hypothetical protein
MGLRNRSQEAENKDMRAKWNRAATKIEAEIRATLSVSRGESKTVDVYFAPLSGTYVLIPVSEGDLPPSDWQFVSRKGLSQ